MIDVYLIRHGATAGNLEGRYIGSATDEALCGAGLEAVKEKAGRIPMAELVVISPMKRCRETAALLFPGQPQETERLLQECYFGKFENKNHLELEGDKDYQAWIDSNGTLPFPEGESTEAFRNRCVLGFTAWMDQCLERRVKTAAFVVHGGTIMSILSELGRPRGTYFSYQVKNVEGYHILLDEKVWKENREFQILEKV